MTLLKQITRVALGLGFLAHITAAPAGPIKTNSVVVENPPVWLKDRRIEKITDKVESFLEWKIRRVNVRWEPDAGAFARGHGLGNHPILAYTRANEQTIHLGPQVTDANFDGTFGHELVHVVIFQKYAEAIPPWLVEGLANFVAKNSVVDYVWLASRPAIPVESLVHPFRADPRYHYMASTALMEMLAKKCDLRDLIQMSVKKKLADQIRRLCGINDINATFAEWVKYQAGAFRKPVRKKS
ncbi:MAG: hypothetical protein AB7P04_13375 [Bacteriovoracia bacterium]